MWHLEALAILTSLAHVRRELVSNADSQPHRLRCLGLMVPTTQGHRRPRALRLPQVEALDLVNKMAD